MDYVDLLRDIAERNESIVCVGLDPIIERIPHEHHDIKEMISDFYIEMLDEFVREGSLPGAVKPNYAFYAQYGFDGLKALEKIIKKSRKLSIPVIFDGKRGDIGKTSSAYAKEAFDFWEADSLTVAPYMGADSVGPFIKECETRGKGIYILNRTSNKGAAEIQNLKVDGKELYMKVAEKIVEWGNNAHGNVGAVVGATSLNELETIVRFYSSQKNPVPLLIPGVGAQGGSAKEVTDSLRKVKYDLGIVRINSSSDINYAHEKSHDVNFAKASAKALEKLNKEIGFK
ncbi:MAG: orotidine-5'-phosphate decarboxylase [Candidatus Diapherotrites archaeon]